MIVSLSTTPNEQLLEAIVAHDFKFKIMDGRAFSPSMTGLNEEKNGWRLAPPV
jgi:hypothetical protein